jgi:hypothetical protein
MTKRKTIVEPVAVESFYDLLDQKTPEEAIEMMKLEREYYKDRDVYFSLERPYLDSDLELHVYERREETDAEYKKRIAAEKKFAGKMKELESKKKDKEYAEYLRLLKKFG